MRANYLIFFAAFFAFLVSLNFFARADTVSLSTSEDSFIASSEEELEEPQNFDYRAEIRALFGQKGNNARVVDSDDESDMEASGFEMAREEARAARLARLEDEEEERRLEERAKEKKRRKLEAEQKKKVGK